MCWWEKMTELEDLKTYINQMRTRFEVYKVDFDVLKKESEVLFVRDKQILERLNVISNGCSLSQHNLTEIVNIKNMLQVHLKWHKSGPIEGFEEENVEIDNQLKMLEGETSDESTRIRSFVDKDPSAVSKPSWKSYKSLDDIPIDSKIIMVTKEEKPSLLNEGWTKERFPEWKLKEKPSTLVKCQHEHIIHCYVCGKEVKEEKDCFCRECWNTTKGTMIISPITNIPIKGNDGKLYYQVEKEELENILNFYHYFLKQTYGQDMRSGKFENLINKFNRKEGIENK